MLNLKKNTILNAFKEKYWEKVAINDALSLNAARPDVIAELKSFSGF